MCRIITSLIRTQIFDQVLCDLGASVSVMPKDVFDRLNYKPLAPSQMHLQLPDSSIWYPTGITKDTSAKIRDCFVPVDFIVLDMEMDRETSHPRAALIKHR